MHSDWSDFFINLSLNNNRVWFNAHKQQYLDLRRQWIEDIALLTAEMSDYEPSFARLDPAEAVYRIYRDTRFSPDKTPYKTYLSAGLSSHGRKSPEAGYYIQADIRPGKGGLYAGLYCPEPAILKKVRKAIVDNIEEFEEIVNSPEIISNFPDWYGERLKTAPKGWPKDHPSIFYLRLKDFGKFLPLSADYFSDPSWPCKAAETLRPLAPLIRFLNYSAFEEEI